MEVVEVEMEPHQLLTARDQVISNPVILENIFKYLPLPDLKSVRLVSTLWRDTSIFRKRTLVKFGDILTLTRFLEVFATTPVRRMVFRNYKFRQLLFDSDSDDVLVAFWDKFGVSIQTLILSAVTIVGVDVIREVLFEKCPNLRSISIGGCRFYETFETEKILHKGIAGLDENARVNANLTSLNYYCGSLYVIKTFSHKVYDLPISWEEIFMAYPNLRHVTIDDGAPTILSIMESAASLKMKNSRTNQWQRLHLLYEHDNTGEIPPHFMDRIYSLQLSLKELEINLGASVNSQEIFRLFQQQKNVEKLHLRGGQHGLPTSGFPWGVQFNQLRYLELSDTISDSMEFILFMPNLSKLVLRDPSDTDEPLNPNNVNNVIARTDKFFSQMPLLTKLTSLTIDYPISSSDVKKLVLWFPGVVKAKLYLDNKGFRSVCRHWRNLAELKVLGGKLSSEGITGIYELRGMNTAEAPNGSLVKEYNPANITCLINLRRFIMVNAHESTAIDDICVDEGFLQLRYLNYLEICTKHISEDGWTKLSNWAQLQSLERVEPFELESDDEEQNDEVSDDDVSDEEVSDEEDSEQEPDADPV